MVICANDQCGNHLLSPQMFCISIGRGLTCYIISIDRGPTLPYQCILYIYAPGRPVWNSCPVHAGRALGGFQSIPIFKNVLLLPPVPVSLWEKNSAGTRNKFRRELGHNFTQRSRIYREAEMNTNT